MIVTRQLQVFAAQPDYERLRAICEKVGHMRTYLWQRFGSLATFKQTVGEIRQYITELHPFDRLELDGTVRAENTKDIINDIVAYREAAKRKTAQDIYRRYPDEQTRRELCGLLKSDAFLKHSYVHRRMRLHFKHGKGKSRRGFVMRSDKFRIETDAAGMMSVVLHFSRKAGGDIVLTTRVKTDKTPIQNRNLFVRVEDGKLFIHYAYEKKAKRPCGTGVVAADKGFTEVFATSSGKFFGEGLGKLIIEYCELTTKTNRQRSKLWAYVHKLEKNGDFEKAERIRKNNLGSLKRNSRQKRFEEKAADLIYKAVHRLVDEGEDIVVEDLTAVFQQQKELPAKVKRWLSTWVKGKIREALDSVAELRGARVHPVNAAYTSQTDSSTGVLSGRRQGDRFYRESGENVHADTNAARAILLRFFDPEITLYTPYTEVKAILERRTREYESEIASGGNWPSKGSSWMAPVLNGGSNTECGKKHDQV